ncbi:MAG: hypothetical protein KIT16_18685 [Rhodospirillaceae bacterium]|nr:hypothetical protein [Rhodospirillaceae bacterium]
MKRIVAVALLALTGLAGCMDTPKDRGICPRVAVLSDAGKITKFRPGAPQTAANIMFTAEMTEIKIACKYNDQVLIEMEANVFVTMILRKGPAMTGDVAEVPYFVTVADLRGTVLSKRVFPLKIDFKGNPAVEHIERSWQFYRLKRGYSGNQYETWAGFQLSDAELEFNRRPVR